MSNAEGQEKRNRMYALLIGVQDKQDIYPGQHAQVVRAVNERSIH